MPSRYQALQQERATLLDQAEQLLELEEPTEEQTAEAQAIIEERVPALDAQLDRFEQLFEAERREPAASPPATPARAPITASPGIERDPWRGFADAADFGRAVHQACRPGNPRVDPRLLEVAGGPHAQPTNFHQETHSADGEGYLVPPQLRDEVFELVFSGDDLVTQVDPEPTESNAVKLIRDESTPWGATGIQAFWRREAEKMTPSKLKTEGALVELDELYAFVTATEELLEDAPRLNQRLTVGSSRAISWVASDAIMWADGVGKPLGWMKSKALVTVGKETGQPPASIVPENLTKMFARLLVNEEGASLPRWYANRDIVPQLVGLTIGDQPAWAAQNQGLRDAPQGLLLGLPLRFTEHAETLGTEGDIQLADVSGYYAAVKRGGVRFASSIHLLFDYNMAAFRWIFRMTGMPLLTKPVTPARGGAAKAKSHFVALQTRA